MKSERVIKGKLMNESKERKKGFPLATPPSTERRFLNIRREGFGSI